MNLYRISQDVNDDYDTYDSAIVCAETAEEAKLIHPDGDRDPYGGEMWAKPEDVGVVRIGTAAGHLVKGVVLSSFNSG